MRAEVGSFAPAGASTPPHPPPTPCGFSTQQTVGGGESSGKRKFCYKVATQREPGGWQKIEKKNQKNSKKTEKMKKWIRRTEGDFDNFVVKKKSAKNPLPTP